jgi:hypothetical protein
MRYTWVNTSLLVLLAIQILTGFFGLISGSERFSWVLWSHAVGGYTVVVILLWKGVVIIDAFRRRGWRRLTAWVFLLLALILLGILITGIVWTHFGPYYIGGFSLLTIHGNLAILLLLLLLWHLLARRFIFRVGNARDRRAFFRLAGISLAGLAVWGLTDQMKAAAKLPGSQRRFTGSYERGSFSGQFPTTSWLFDYPEPLAAADWQLTIAGAVAQPLSLTYQDLLQMPSESLTATLDCTGGWYSTQVWQGVPLAHLLDLAGVSDEAASITVEAVSGYSRRFQLETARGYLLGLEVAENPLIHGHGFPVRLVAPGQRGFNWVKWVTRIRVNTSSHLWQPPVPLQ